MRILDLVVDIVEWDVTTIPVVDDRGHIGGRIHHGVVRMQTDMDVEATGLLGPIDNELAPCLVQLTEVIKPRLLDCRLSDLDQIWARLDGWVGHGFPLQPAMAAVDIALWDAVAKVRGCPSTPCWEDTSGRFPWLPPLLLFTRRRSWWSSRW